MAITLIGGTAGDVPFNRTFFNVTLGEMFGQNAKEKTVRLSLYLSDGTTLDVSAIDELSDSYLALRAYQGETDHLDPSIHLIPYGLIYRIEVSPKGEQNSRVGFQWKPSARKIITTKRSR